MTRFRVLLDGFQEPLLTIESIALCFPLVGIGSLTGDVGRHVKPLTSKVMAKEERMWLTPT
jgi:hypothetical protein